MQYRYSIEEISIGQKFIFSVLRKKRLFDLDGNEIPLADQTANYRCTLAPSLNIDKELSKLSADGANLNPELLAFMDQQLRQTLQIWWTPEVVQDYLQSLDGIQYPEGVAS